MQFTNENHVQEIKGVYVPFWMFDGEAEGSAQYEATRSRCYTSGDYEVTETDHFDVYREGSHRLLQSPRRRFEQNAGRLHGLD